MSYAIDNIVLLINRKEPLPTAFVAALKVVSAQTAKLGLYNLTVDELITKLGLSIRRDQTHGTERYINCDYLYKLVSILDRNGISMTPPGVPRNLSLYNTVYLIKKPDLSLDQDVNLIQHLVQVKKTMHTNSEIDCITRAKEKLYNYNLLVRVFECFGSAQSRSLDANQRSILNNIISGMLLPHDGDRYIRSLYSYVCDYGSYQYDFSNPKYVSKPLSDADQVKIITIVAKTLAPSHQQIIIPEDFPYRVQLSSIYEHYCPVVYNPATTESNLKVPVKDRPLSMLTLTQRRARLKEQLNLTLDRVNYRGYDAEARREGHRERDELLAQRMGFSSEFIRRVVDICGIEDTELNDELTGLNMSLFKDTNTRLMLPDFSKTRFVLYTNGGFKDDYRNGNKSQQGAGYAQDGAVGGSSAPSSALKDGAPQVDGMAESSQSGKQSGGQAGLGKDGLANDGYDNGAQAGLNGSADSSLSQNNVVQEGLKASKETLNGALDGSLDSEGVSNQGANRNAAKAFEGDGAEVKASAKRSKTSASVQDASSAKEDGANVSAASDVEGAALSSTAKRKLAQKQIAIDAAADAQKAAQLNAQMSAQGQGASQGQGAAQGQIADNKSTLTLQDGSPYSSSADMKAKAKIAALGGSDNGFEAKLGATTSLSLSSNALSAGAAIFGNWADSGATLSLTGSSYSTLSQLYGEDESSKDGLDDAHNDGDHEANPSSSALKVNDSEVAAQDLAAQNKALEVADSDEISGPVVAEDGQDSSSSSASSAMAGSSQEDGSVSSENGILSSAASEQTSAELMGSAISQDDRIAYAEAASAAMRVGVSLIEGLNQGATFSEAAARETRARGTGPKSKVRYTIESSAMISEVDPEGEREREAENILIDPTYFSDAEVNKLNRSRGRAKGKQVMLGSQEQFHLVPYVFDELSLFYHSYMVWADDPKIVLEEPASARPSCDSDYSSNLEQFIYYPLKQIPRLDKVITFELVLRKLFANDYDSCALDSLGRTDEADVKRFFDLACVNDQWLSAVNPAPLLFYHSLYYFDKYLQSPQTHFNNELFYAAIFSKLPYGINIYLERIIAKYGSRLIDIPKEFYTIIAYAALIFPQNKHAQDASDILSFMYRSGAKNNLLYKVILIRELAHKLYCLVHENNQLSDVCLRLVSEADLVNIEKTQEQDTSSERTNRLISIAKSFLPKEFLEQDGIDVIIENATKSFQGSNLEQQARVESDLVLMENLSKVLLSELRVSATVIKALGFDNIEGGVYDADAAAAAAAARDGQALNADEEAGAGSDGSSSLKAARASSENYDGAAQGAASLDGAGSVDGKAAAKGTAKAKRGRKPKAAVAAEGVQSELAGLSFDDDEGLGKVDDQGNKIGSAASSASGVMGSEVVVTVHEAESKSISLKRLKDGVNSLDLDNSGKTFKSSRRYVRSKNSPVIEELSDEQEKESIIDDYAERFGLNDDAAPRFVPGAKSSVAAGVASTKDTGHKIVGLVNTGGLFDAPEVASTSVGVSSRARVIKKWANVEGSSVLRPGARRKGVAPSVDSNLLCEVLKGCGYGSNYFNRKVYDDNLELGRKPTRSDIMSLYDREHLSEAGVISELLVEQLLTRDNLLMGINLDKVKEFLNDFALMQAKLWPLNKSELGESLNEVLDYEEQLNKSRSHEANYELEKEQLLAKLHINDRIVTAALSLAVHLTFDEPASNQGSAFDGIPGERRQKISRYYNQIEERTHSLGYGGRGYSNNNDDFILPLLDNYVYPLMRRVLCKDNQFFYIFSKPIDLDLTLINLVKKIKYDYVKDYIVSSLPHNRFVVDSFVYESDAPRHQELRDFALSANDAYHIGFPEGIDNEFFQELSGIFRANLQVQIAPVYYTNLYGDSFAKLRPKVNHIRLIDIPPLFHGKQNQSAFDDFMYSLYCGYVILELLSSLLAISNTRGLITLLVQEIITIHRFERREECVSFALQYLDSCATTIKLEGPIAADLILDPSFELDTALIGNRSSNRLRHLLTMAFGYEIKNSFVADIAKRQYVRLMDKLHFISLSDMYNQQRPDFTGSRGDKNAKFTGAGADTELALAQITPKVNKQLEFDMDKIKAKLDESAQVQAVITRLREQEEAAAAQAELAALKNMSKAKEGGVSVYEQLDDVDESSVLDFEVKEKKELSLANLKSGKELDEALKADDKLSLEERKFVKGALQGAQAIAKSQSELQQSRLGALAEANAREQGQSAAQTDEQGKVVSQSTHPINSKLNAKIREVIEAIAIQGTDAMVFREFNGLCVSHGLISGNYCIEVLNEYTFEEYDEPVLELDGEGDNAIVYITTDLLSEMYQHCLDLKKG